MNHHLVLLVVFLLSQPPCCSLSAQTASDDPATNTQSLDIPFTPPAEAVKLFDPPNGFNVTLFAAEPDVHQPVAATFDDRGRLWVVECYTYSDRKENYNTRLNDRIVIFEDRDNDGRFDQRTIFWDQGKKLTGIAVGFGGVWLTSAPNLIFIPDRDCDDVPDGPPEVLLDGFEDNVARHNIVNGPKFMHDGWLYGRHGIMATSFVGPPGATASQRQSINCGIWRYHPVHRKFEIVAHGGTNPWGLDYDEHGEMFMINTVIGHLFHVVPGARFRRMWGAHFNPHTYQVIPQTADHFHWDVGTEGWTASRESGLSDATDVAGGGHAHSGLMIYQGDNWPDSFRSKLFTLNFHGRRINSDSIHRHGNSYTAHHGEDYFKTSDPWFRGVELLCGPDGGVFVLDWSDIGECHENDGIHRTSGRIYKLTHGEPTSPQTPQHGDLNQLSSSQLIELLGEKNQWYARHARRILQERAVEQAAETTNVSGSDRSNLVERDALLADYEAAINVPRKLQSMWALYACGFADADWLRQQTRHKDEHVRTWAVRLLTDGVLPIDSSTVDLLAELAAEDASGLVRLYIASSLARLEASDVLRVAEQLAAHAADADDRVQPKLIWCGLEPHVVANADQAIELARGTAMPLIRQNIMRRLAYEIESQPAATEAIVNELLNAETDQVRLQILGGMWQALDGIDRANAPSNWNEVVEKFAEPSDEQIKQHVQQLSLVFGDGRTLKDLRRMISDGKADIAKRKRAIAAVAKSNADAKLFEQLKPMLSSDVFRGSVAAALVHCDQPEVATALLKFYGSMTAQEQAITINTLVARPEWARELLRTIGNGAKQIPPSTLTSAHARQIANFDRPELTERLTEVWGRVNASSADRQQQLERLRAQLTDQQLAKADVVRGKALFDQHCASCHVMHGHGGRIGPDLTGSDRKNLNYLLENMLEPSAVVAEPYQTTLVMLEDGRLLTGLVVEQTERTLRLQTKDELISLDVRSIEETKRTKLSLMPDGLLDPLTLKQKTDLIGFLMR